MMIVLPDADGPNVFDKSTVIVSTFPLTFMATFFIANSFLLPRLCPGAGSLNRGSG